MAGKWFKIDIKTLHMHKSMIVLKMSHPDFKNLFLQLLMPVDENLHEFWIDFNVGSQSISFYFCLADDQAKVFVKEFVFGLEL